MKKQLMKLYSQLVRNGFHNTAKRILYKLINHDNSITIWDNDNEAYESGFAQWLQDNCNWYNRKNGFTARIN